MVEDILAHESAGEIWRHPDGSAEILIAVRVTAERARVWGEHFPLWARTAGGLNGPNLSAEKGWLFAVNRGGSELATAFRRRVASSTREAGTLLEFSKPPGTWPGVSLAAVASNGAVRWSGTIDSPGMAALDLKEWSFPTNAVRDPLVALTAIRGVTPSLARFLGVEDRLSGQQIGQFFHWAQTDSAFQSFAALHLSEPGKLVARLHDELAPLYTTNAVPGKRLGLLMYDPRQRMLALSAAPGAAPTLNAPTNEGPGFVALGLFPLKRTSGPAPKELLDQLLPPDLVFYEWEVTSENVVHWIANLQVRDICSGLRPPAGDGPVIGWLQGASASLDNTVTGVRQIAPGRFSVTRKAPGGLGALELVLLSRWVDPPTTRGVRRAAPVAQVAPRTPPAP
jgi:hypothetical protein